MKLKNRSIIYSSLLLFCSFIFLNGCATTGIERSEKTSTSIEQVEGDFRKIITQADETNSSLNALVMSEQNDFKKYFDNYSGNLEKLENQGNLLIKHTDELKKQSKEYFKEWKKQDNVYTNPQIRELSEQRHNELSEKFAHIPEESNEIARTYRAYLSDLKEIHQYLSNDLTPKGIESINPVIKQTEPDLESLKTSINTVLTHLSEFKSELYGK